MIRFKLNNEEIETRNLSELIQFLEEFEPEGMWVKVEYFITQEASDKLTVAKQTWPALKEHFQTVLTEYFCLIAAEAEARQKYWNDRIARND